MSTQKIATTASRQINAVVVSAGLMSKTVKVRIGTQKWHSKIGKSFSQSKILPVHDARSSLRTGDVISISAGWRVSKTVRHVVTRIISPFGEPIEARPPVMTEIERLAEREQKIEAKAIRKGRILPGNKVEEAVAEAEART